MLGKAIITSMTRMTRRSTGPPAYPAMSPTGAPTRSAMPTAMKPTRSDRRAP